MKEKLILTFCVIGISIGIYTYALAAFEIKSINVDFVSKTARVSYSEGDYVTTNTTLVNGDTEQRTKFVASKDLSTGILRSSFDQQMGSLVQQQALNMDAIATSLLGVSNVAVAGMDTSVTIIPAPVSNTEIDIQTNTDTN